jgi:hypothetical protein
VGGQPKTPIVASIVYGKHWVSQKKEPRILSKSILKVLRIVQFFLLMNLFPTALDTGVLYDPANYERLTTDWDNECGLIAYNFLKMPAMNPTPAESRQLCSRARSLYFPDAQNIDPDGSAHDIATVYQQFLLILNPYLLFFQIPI